MNQPVFILFNYTLKKPCVENNWKNLIGLVCICSTEHTYVKHLNFPSTNKQFYYSCTVTASTPKKAITEIFSVSVYTQLTRAVAIVEPHLYQETERKRKRKSGREKIFYTDPPPITANWFANHYLRGGGGGVA